MGRPIIVFSGGEPLLRDDWEPLAGHVRSLGLRAALATNGTMINAALAGRIASAGFERVSVSLDGADSATHDVFRGADGAFDAARTGVENLRSAGVAVQINSTITAHNADQLDELYALTRSLGAVALHVFLLVPVGCGLEIAPTHQLPPHRCEQVLNWVCDQQDDGGLELRATCAPHYFRIATQRGVTPQGTRGCLAGTAVAFVSHRGEVFPCGYLPVNCGSVRRKSFAEIWRRSEVFAALRDPGQLEGRCGSCEFKTICGGCRARAFAACGNLLGEDPACAYTPKGKGQSH